jgi:hypothetical protein
MLTACGLAARKCAPYTYIRWTYQGGTWNLEGPNQSPVNPRKISSKEASYVTEQRLLQIESHLQTQSTAGPCKGARKASKQEPNRRMNERASVGPGRCETVCWARGRCRTATRRTELAGATSFSSPLWAAAETTRTPTPPCNHHKHRTATNEPRLADHHQSTTPSQATESASLSSQSPTRPAQYSAVQLRTRQIFYWFVDCRWQSEDSTHLEERRGGTRRSEVERESPRGWRRNGGGGGGQCEGRGVLDRFCRGVDADGARPA